MLYSTNNAVIPVQHIASVDVEIIRDNWDEYHNIYIETVGGKVYHRIYNKEEGSDFQRDHKRLLDLIKTYHGAMTY